MNRDGDGANAAGPIDLAREAPFALAHLTVTPAALSVDVQGWSRHLEPRAMQVLVVLARASPAVVGRGELNARVWGGRVVGDDAINRAVQTLRRVATDAPAPPPFSIGTIPRVGYRLLAAATPADAQGAAGLHGTDASASAVAFRATSAGDPIATAGARRHRPRYMLWVAAAAALTVLALLLAGPVSRLRAPASVDWRIAGSATLDDLPPGAGDVALSPDGRRLAYRGLDAQGRERIFVRAAEGGGAGSPVSPAAVDARHPVWSPDGAELAFSAYDAGRPCWLYVARPGGPASRAGTCETVRDPRLAWSADGRSLLFGDAPGENAVQRIGAVRIADGRRAVLSSPPGDSMGDGLPLSRGKDIVFQRQFGWADEGWIARDAATGRERLLWRRRGVAGSVAAPLPDGMLAIAWTQAGASGLDFVGADGRVRSQPLALGPVTAISVAGSRLLVETDRSESALTRAGGLAVSAPPLVRVRGRIAGPVLLPDGRLRFPVTSAGVARIWERAAAGTLAPWGSFVAARISGLAPSTDGGLTAALVTGDAGREIMLFDATGKAVFRWNPHARSLNPAAWSGDGRRLIVPVLDGAGWRLFSLDPFTGNPPRDLGLPGFAVVLDRGAALYAIRAGETTGGRELWRLDGRARRLPIDLTLFDIVNWRAADDGIWLPDRSDRRRPRLILHDERTGRAIRRADAPGLAGSGSGLAADARGPVYVQTARDAPEYGLLTLSDKDAQGSSDSNRGPSVLETDALTS